MAATKKNRVLESNGAIVDHGTSSTEQIIIEPIKTQSLAIEIVGVTPLVVCAWSHKAKQEILDKQMKKAKKAKEAKNPEECYKSSKYVSTEGWEGIPATGFKGCLVNTCRTVDDLPMTVAKRMMFVRPQGTTQDGQGLIRIHGESEMHEGMVRLDKGGADIRYRAMYREWSMVVEIEFIANIVSAEQIANLVQRAGFVEGLCEHRPGSPKSNTGDWGRFMIKERK